MKATNLLVSVAVIAIACIPIAFFIGDTSISFRPFSVKVKNPLTALMFYATVIAALIEAVKDLKK